jgi:hypothetical protein
MGLSRAGFVDVINLCTNLNLSFAGLQFPMIAEKKKFR